MLSSTPVRPKRFVMDDTPGLKGLISPLLVPFPGLLPGLLVDFISGRV